MENKRKKSIIKSQKIVKPIMNAYKIKSSTKCLNQTYLLVGI